MENFDLKEAQGKLDWADYALRCAASDALWRLSSGWGLKSACKKASEKFNYKPISKIEREVRRVLPEGYLKQKSARFIRTNFKSTPEQAVLTSKMRQMEKQSLRHIKDIVSD